MNKADAVKNYMKHLGVTKAEAEQLWADDHADVVGAEGEELQKKAKTASDFTKLLTDKDNDGKDDNTGISYSTQNLLESDKEFADEATRAIIKKMNNDQISDVLETDKAYYVFKMINNNDPAAYDSEVKNKISAEEDSQYQKYYDETLSKQYKFKVTGYWKERVTIGGITA
jgi:parvulin-like peptidyl-prolyl isomerase